MNHIHKLNLLALIVLSLIMVSMLVQHWQANRRMQSFGQDSAVVLKKEYDKKIARDTLLFKEVTELIKQMKITPALEKLQAVHTEHPDNSRYFVYKAQLDYKSGHLAEAIHSYRLAVDNEPDFVDKKTPLYIGRQIMELINEGRGKLNRERKLKPGDTSITRALEDVYYLQRRIAGGCE